MEKIKAYFGEFLGGSKRVGFDLVIFAFVVFVFFNGLYESLSNPLQLLLLKIVLISAGALHAHYMGKFFFSKINWDLKITEQKGAYFARVGLYIIIPICYSIGG